MPIGRFKEYSGSDADAISLAAPRSLDVLENLPALLMYELHSEGPNPRLVRHARLRNIAEDRVVFRQLYRSLAGIVVVLAADVVILRLVLWHGLLLVRRHLPGESRQRDAAPALTSTDGYFSSCLIEYRTSDTAAHRRAYKNLATVERAFRSLKTIDLEVRPIHHRLILPRMAHAAGPQAHSVR